MRVVGYIREAVGERHEATAFVQSEQIRRWVSENGHRVVAVCQDVKTPGHALGRDGLKALIGIVDTGQVDGVVVAGLETLSADVIVQEVVLWDLRSRNVRILSTSPEDVAALADPPRDPTRRVIRDVLARVSEHLAYFVAPAPRNAVIDLIPEAGDHTPVELEFVQAVSD